MSIGCTFPEVNTKIRNNFIFAWEKSLNCGVQRWLGLAFLILIFLHLTTPSELIATTCKEGGAIAAPGNDCAQSLWKFGLRCSASSRV
jgi:hypothetical protein